MSEGVMDSTRLVQIFLGNSGSSGPGVYEVSLTKDKTFICTCPGFTGRRACKHVKFVNNKVQQNNGTYPLEISTRVTDEDAAKAQESSESFREFLTKFGKIEIC